MFAEKLSVQCHEEYQTKRKELDTQEAIDQWTRTLENDLAELHDLDARDIASTKVLDISDELVTIVCQPWHTVQSRYLLTILIRAAALHEITSTYCSSSALSTHTTFRHNQCLELVWVRQRCAQCWLTMVSSSRSISCSMI